MSLYQEWIEAKEMERLATERRREIEDLLSAQFDLAPDLDGTKNFADLGFKIKVVGRLTHKIDVEKIKEIAVEHGLEADLDKVVRWKAELNLTAWKNNEGLSTVFSPAVTVSAGRPSYTIEKA